MHPIDWWRQEEEKKDKMRKANDVFLINRQLQELLKRLEEHMERSKYEEEARIADRYLDRTSIWDIGYLNNMENERVALLQGLFISHIIRQENLEEILYFQSQVDSLMRRLGDVDWGLYLEYGNRKEQGFIEL